MALQRNGDHRVLATDYIAIETVTPVTRSGITAQADK